MATFVVQQYLGKSFEKEGLVHWKPVCMTVGDAPWKRAHPKVRAGVGRGDRPSTKAGVLGGRMDSEFGWVFGASICVLDEVLCIL